METNLSDLLRKIKAQADKAVPGAAPLGNGKSLYITISEEEREWINLYLQAPDTVIDFKSNRTGEWKVLDDLTPEMAQQYIETGNQVDGKPAEPAMNYHLTLKGGPDDIFVLLSEACLQNPEFANILIGVGKFYKEHVPHCPLCQQSHPGRPGHDCPDFEEFTGWDFHKRQNSNDAKK